MATQSANFAPYASFGNAQLVFKRIRSGWTPSQIDSGDLEKIGISKSTVNRAMAMLVFLGLVDEEGRTNDNTWKALATATENEYPELLAGILRNAYPGVFEIYPNPGDATDVQLANAFRRSEPLQQRDRMVSLFRGLCQEANLIAGEPITREQKPSIKQPQKVVLGGGAPAIDGEKLKEAFGYPQKINPSLKWYKDLEPLMTRLPKSDNSDERPSWTAEEKQRWLAALQAMLDLLIDVKN